MRGHLAVLIFCGGCTVQSADPPMCTARGGSYMAHFVEQPGGTCGPMADQQFGIDPNLPDVAASCTGEAAYTRDHCDESFDLTCPTASGHGTLQSVGTTSWSASGSSGDATMRYVYRTDAGDVSCQSTYAITYVRAQ
jgi:hypothetical protein